MKTRKLLSALFVVSLVAIVFGAAAVQTTATHDPATTAADQPVTQSGFVFEGCWAYFSAGPCYDIYRDSAGNYWKCKKCGQTGNPGPKSCSRISLQTLNTGYWCS